MIKLNDIYFKVGKELYLKCFDLRTTANQKRLIDTCLKTYLIRKVSEANQEQAQILSENKDITVDDLVDMLGERIPEEEHFDTMRHLTHFILNIAGDMQNFSITWWEDQNPTFIDNPLIKFNHLNKLDSLTTHKKTSYVDTFHFVYDVFINEFQYKNSSNKQLTLKDTRKQQ